MLRIGLPTLDPGARPRIQLQRDRSIHYNETWRWRSTPRYKQEHHIGSGMSDGTNLTGTRGHDEELGGR